MWPSRCILSASTLIAFALGSGVVVVGTCTHTSAGGLKSDRLNQAGERSRARGDECVRERKLLLD